ncbi:MAG: YfiR family protein [Candidatus Zixiibacteriota bacterium]
MATLLAPTAMLVAAKNMTPDEIDYKADFIVKVVDYVTWPEGAGTNANGEIAIGVIGESPLTPKLKELAAAREGGKMTVTVVTSDADLSVFQILFLTTEDKTELAKILKKVQNAPVLTISDAYYFARHGVMVNFYSEDVDGKAKIKFEVNQMTLGFVGLKMSSKLLKLATII